MLTSILEFILTYWSIALLIVIIFLGAVEGVCEAYLNHLDNQSEITTPGTVNTAFWTKRKFKRFSYKCLRLIVLFAILSISWIATIKVVIAFWSVGFVSISLHYAILIPSYKLYKAFTKVMSDVENKTDEAAKDASKIYSGYDTAFTLVERLKGLNPATSEDADEKKDSTDEK